MNIKIGVSNRHVHLTQEDLYTLFGQDYVLNKKADIKQPGQYACMETVTIKTFKNTIDNVRILGPVRAYTQFEMSATDARFLGLEPPLRDSGDLDGSSVVTIIGPKGKITKSCGIIVRRHIHITKEDKEKYNLPDVVSVKVKGERGGIMDNVYVKESTEAYFEMHVDTDEANAYGLKNDAEVEIMY